MPRECETASLSTSLRGALATKQSIPPFARLDGLLRGACHPAALCADRVARNDPEGACHVLCVIACECGASSTPRLSAQACRLWNTGSPVPATPRLRRGSAVLARRSFSEGGKPGDDGCLMSMERQFYPTSSRTSETRSGIRTTNAAFLRSALATIPSPLTAVVMGSRPRGTTNVGLIARVSHNSRTTHDISSVATSLSHGQARSRVTKRERWTEYTRVAGIQPE